MDARAGPGMKSMTKFKTKHKKMLESREKSPMLSALASTVKKGKRNFDRELSPTLSDKSDGTHDVEMADVDFAMSESGPSTGSSRTTSPDGSDIEETVVSSSRRHKGVAKRRENIPQISEFIDLEFWKM